MKKVSLILVGLLLLSCQQKTIGINWTIKSFDEILNQSNNKIVMLDFYTDN
jgi:hypothetical protein